MVHAALRSLSRLCLCLNLCAGTAQSLAQTATAPPVSDLQVAVWATSCMACHGTDGRAEGTGLNLSGMAATEFRTRMFEFKRGTRPGTVMPEHAKGYSDAEIELIAAYFAARSRGVK